jgi:hypothetical protein
MTPARLEHPGTPAGRVIASGRPAVRLGLEHRLRRHFGRATGGRRVR